MPKKKKYYPNNWKQFKNQPDKFFIPLEYEDFYQWKVNGWVLPSSVCCIIREEDINTGAVSEKVYSRHTAAQKYLNDKMSTDDKIFTICDETTVQSLLPKRLLKDKKLRDTYDLEEEDDYED